MFRYLFSLFIFVAVCSGINLYETCVGQINCRVKADEALSNLWRSTLTDFAMPTAFNDKFGIKSSDSLWSDYAVQASNFRRQEAEFKLQDDKIINDLNKPIDIAKKNAEKAYNDYMKDPNRPFKF